MEIDFYLAMQLGPNSTQMQAGLPVILVCCGAHLGWFCCSLVPPGLQWCFSTCSGDPHPPAGLPVLLTWQERTGQQGHTARTGIWMPWQAATDPLALKRRVMTTCLHPPPGEWALAGGSYLWWGSASGGFACVCHEQLLGMGERENTEWEALL